MDLIAKLQQNKILPIIRSQNIEEIINKSLALKAGGIDVVEINITNPKVYEAIKELSNEMTVIAGGIITALQMDAAIENGAKVITSPIFQNSLTKMTKAKKIPYIAGVSTANEAYEAWKARVPLVKIYPISAMGGVKYIENLLRPMNFLKIIPQGNVKLNEVGSYLKAGAIAVGVGRDLFSVESEQVITERTKEILERLKHVR